MTETLCKCILGLTQQVLGQSFVKPSAQSLWQNVLVCGWGLDCRDHPALCCLCVVNEKPLHLLQVHYLPITAPLIPHWARELVLWGKTNPSKLCLRLLLLHCCSPISSG